ncbi:MAG TPA: histidine phosphatase family protein [Daejeonella sp.]|nr:histidine phosphatase family protein [Daejeonella sp.]
MKQLLIIRHAKSDKGTGQIDFDRPLNERGLKDAPKMAKRLAHKGIIPKQIVSSPAVRTMSTAVYFAKEFDIKASDILQEKAIYEASANTLLRVINQMDNSSDFTALVGHNPGLSDLALDLCHGDIQDIPTCGIVLIEFPFDKWAMISKGTGDLKLFDYPKKE